MLSVTFHDLGGCGADDPDFSVDLTMSTAIFRTPEILYIIHRNSYTSQGDPDSSFPLWMGKLINSNNCCEVTDQTFAAEMCQRYTCDGKKEIPYWELRCVI